MDSVGENAMWSMVRGKGLGALLAVFVLAQAVPAVADTPSSSPLVQEAQQAVAQLETNTGMPIVMLARSDNDLTTFYTTAMQTLCAKTGTNWCDTDLYTVLTDTTNPLGWARVLTYAGSDNVQKTVCAILPPEPGISATYAATGISGGTTSYDWRDLPTNEEAEAWLTMDYGGVCLSTLGTDQEQKRADAFASLSLTLMEGNGIFVAAQDVSPARKFSYYRNAAVNTWAVNTGERALLELWKAQAAVDLQQANCNAVAVPSTNLDTPNIQRDGALPPGGNCMPTGYGKPSGQVTDADLWLWTYGATGRTATWPTVDLPPQPYTPFMSFSSFAAGIAYSWQAADALSKQY